MVKQQTMTSDHHIQMRLRPKLLEQSLKHTMVYNWSQMLLLEIYHNEDFSSNPNHTHLTIQSLP